MEKLAFTHADLILMLIAIGTVLILSRFVSELGKKIKLPLVMGEILVGVILGPSVFGKISPHLFYTVFPGSGAEQIALDGITSLAVIMLLFVAGMSVQLNDVLK